MGKLWGKVLGFEYMNRGYYPVREVNPVSARDFTENSRQVNAELSRGMTSEQYRRFLVNRAKTIMTAGDHFVADRMACPHCPHLGSAEKHIYVIPRR